jgi:hypothetical protein
MDCFLRGVLLHTSASKFAAPGAQYIQQRHQCNTTIEDTTTCSKGGLHGPLKNHFEVGDKITKDFRYQYYPSCIALE